MERSTVAAYDASDEAGDGLALARLLADLGGSELVIARVLEDLVQGPVPGAPPTDRATDRAARERVGETGRSVLAAVPEASGAQIAPIIDHRLARGLHEFAEAEDAEFLVFGSSHLGNLGRRLLGDSVELALNGAPCPVAVAPPGFREHPELPARRVAVAFDGSPTARAALDAAVDFARRAGLPLCLVAVESAEEVEGAEPVMETALQEAADALPGDVASETRVRVGEPVDELLEESRHHGLLFAGSRGRGTLQRVLLGSVSLELIRGSACPVVVVPPSAVHGTQSAEAPRPA